MQYDLSHSPFSRRGSFLQIERGFDFNNPRVILGSARRKIWRSLHGGGFGTHFFALHLTEPATDPDYRVDASPSECVGTAEGGRQWRAVVADADTMLFRTHGSGLTFAAMRGMAWAEQRSDNYIIVADGEGRCCHHFRLMGPGRLALSYRSDSRRSGKAGAAHHHAAITACPADGATTLDVAYRNSREEAAFESPPCDYDHARQAAAADYARWASHQSTVAPPYAAAAEFAWFMLWNQQMPVGGGLTRPAIYMSRFWMNSVWAWDACFSAMAVAEADSKLAWDQILLHLDHQTAQGQLPDSVDDGGAAYGWVKPPVQGWAAMKLIATLGIEACMDVLPQLYERLLAWQRWWYAWRGCGTQGLCRYMHGNDSGWDNATVFAEPGPVITPDLQAYLALQWKALGRIALILGKKSEARSHSQQARRQVEAMVRGLKVGDSLGYINPSGRLIPSTSTLTRMAVLLGRDLPSSLRPGLVRDLRPGSPHITDFGVATEATDSPHYLADGYWRGPIWAPETYMAIDGLRGAGEEELAAELARRFCRLCAGPTSAMHENYDARTGEGLRSPAYSWTAAVFLRLAHGLQQPRRTIRPTTRIASAAVPRPASAPMSSGRPSPALT